MRTNVSDAVWNARRRIRLAFKKAKWYQLCMICFCFVVGTSLFRISLESPGRTTTKRRCVLSPVPTRTLFALCGPRRTRGTRSWLRACFARARSGAGSCARASPQQLGTAAPPVRTAAVRTARHHAEQSHAAAVRPAFDQPRRLDPGRVATLSSHCIVC